MLGFETARFSRLVPGLDFKSSVERVATFQAGSIPVPRRHFPSDGICGVKVAVDVAANLTFEVARTWSCESRRAWPFSIST